MHLRTKVSEMMVEGDLRREVSDEHQAFDGLWVVTVACAIVGACPCVVSAPRPTRVPERDRVSRFAR